MRMNIIGVAPARRLAAACLALAFSVAALAQTAYIGRPIYSEPGPGLQLPPGCAIEPTWRSRVANTDQEVWIAQCDNVPRAWLLRRTTIEVVGPNQARLRYQVLDERVLPGESIGDSVSVQCNAREGGEGGFVVIGARWRAAGQELRLASAQTLLRADPATQRLVSTPLAQAECLRYPEREAMMRRLQAAPR